MLLGSDFWGSGVALDIQTKILRKISKSEVSEYSDEEEQEGEGAYPAEEFCIPWDVADFPNYFHFAEDGDGVHSGLIDGVAEEAVAVLEDGVLDIDGIARAVEQAVLEHIDGVVMLRAQIEGIY